MRESDEAAQRLSFTYSLLSLRGAKRRGNLGDVCCIVHVHGCKNLLSTGRIPQLKRRTLIGMI